MAIRELYWLYIWVHYGPRQENMKQYGESLLTLSMLLNWSIDSSPAWNWPFPLSGLLHELIEFFLSLHNIFNKSFFLLDSPSYTFPLNPNLITYSLYSTLDLGNCSPALQLMALADCWNTSHTSMQSSSLWTGLFAWSCASWELGLAKRT